MSFWLGVSTKYIHFAFSSGRFPCLFPIGHLAICIKQYRLSSGIFLSGLEQHIRFGYLYA